MSNKPMQQMFFKSNAEGQRGFTLLEILVVISIIGILIAMGSAAFSTAQQKGRDSKRRADMKAIQNGLEQYYAQFTQYDTAAYLELSIFPGGIPIDPLPSQDYFTTDVATDRYCICALLETGGGNSTTQACAMATPDPSNGYYCVTNLQ